MTNIDWLIVGLGNPGIKYEKNRHNVGWMVIDAIIKKYGLNETQESKKYIFSKWSFKRKNVILAKPLTFMNLSGKAVQALKIKYKIPDERILVVVDDYNFPVGKVHLKAGGSDGGHNGIASIIEETKKNSFYRLRCGIGNDFPKGMLVEYVLSDFRTEEIDDLNNMINKAVQSIETVVEFGAAHAMTLINSERLWKNLPIKNEDTND